MMLPERPAGEREQRPCETCKIVMSRYIHNHKHYCRVCLDNEQYPQFAHLTQEEREQMRLTGAKNQKVRGFLNTGNLAGAS